MLEEEPREKMSDDSRLDKDSVDVFCCSQCFFTFKEEDKFEKHDCNLNEEELLEVFKS